MSIESDSADYLATVALKNAGGDYNKAILTARLATKVLARWKLQSLISEDVAASTDLPLSRLSK